MSSIMIFRTLFDHLPFAKPKKRFKKSLHKKILKLLWDIKHGNYKCAYGTAYNLIEKITIKFHVKFFCSNLGRQQEL